MAFWHYLNFIAFLITLIFNYLAVEMPLGGRKTYEVSERYLTLLTPDNFTFSIWGLIYGSLMIFVFYAFSVVSIKKVTVELFDRIAIPFFFSCGFNSAWLIAWHTERIGLSLLIVIGLLATLITIAVRANINFKERVSREQWLVFFPFSIYLAWASVATTLNVAIFLVSMGFDGGALAQPLSITAVLLVAVLAFIAFYRKNNFLFTFTISWALFGIYSRMLEGSKVFSASKYPVLMQAVFFAMILALILSFAGLVRYVRISRATNTPSFA